ncbi:hypothetical protein CLAFUW4_02435 [Fulvia fulva]|nr:hypothetical protein CLAFUR4_02430 [Fulvia fulva]KAK4633208.1 hypothetical protein CLAFUR0_02434 [Fulvia fulva]WPV10760.1 hypothetical protein CLAFUW4_02435 [Fulvia fulva]WPV25681.1 hypothetical protein CLAFUW7_02435 [Fulvia fulva]
MSAPTAHSAAPVAFPAVPRARTTAAPASPPGLQNYALNRMNSDMRSWAAVTERVPANCVLPRGVNITLAEICTFFPSALQIPHVACRFMRNRVFVNMLAKLELRAIGLENDKKSIRQAESRIKEQNTKAGLYQFGPDTNGRWNLQRALDARAENDLTADHWKLYDGEGFQHYDVRSIYGAVPEFQRWPQDMDRGVVTQILEYAKQHESDGYTTRDWSSLVQRHGFQPPVWPARLPTNGDIEANSRWDYFFGY